MIVHVLNCDFIYWVVGLLDSVASTLLLLLLSMLDYWCRPFCLVPASLLNVGIEYAGMGA
jgi:hypothetical protein